MGQTASTLAVIALVVIVVAIVVWLANMAMRTARRSPLPSPSAAAVPLGKRKPILCLDFDGVIHSYTSGWKGADVIPDPPVPGAIAFMLGALRLFDVVIFSSRSGQPGGIEAMRAYLRDQAGQCWYPSPDGPGLEDVRFTVDKPSAMVTLDDRALTFTGTWPSVESLRAFKPWNKP